MNPAYRPRKVAIGTNSERKIRNKLVASQSRGPEGLALFNAGPMAELAISTSVGSCMAVLLSTRSTRPWLFPTSCPRCGQDVGGLAIHSGLTGDRRLVWL